MVLVDKESELSQEQKLTLILWARKIDISQVAKNILQGGMVDGEGLIKPVQCWDKSIGKYIKPIFLEIGAHGYGLKKEFNDDNEVQLYLHEMPNDIVNGSPEEFDNYVSVEEGTLTVKYEPEEVINFMYNEIYCEAQSIILNCLDDIYHKCNLERNQVERINKDNIIEVKPAMGATGQGSDDEAGWKLPVDQILTTTTLPTGVSAGYRVAIVTSSVMAIKEYNGSSWDTESLDPYSVIPLKHSGSIQMYLAKSTGPVYMGVEYGVFGKFRFMTQAAYDALSSYDNDTIYFVRSS